MAAEDSVISEVEKLELDDATSCCICTDVYIDPKLLPCMHTFCMKCIRETGLKTNKEPGDEMPCPICRQQFKIPPEGFHGLPNNSFIEKLIQVENISNQSVLSNDTCDACLEENEEEEASEQIPAADVYCVECRQKLCVECCRHHRKVKLTKNHKLLPIKELQKSSESVMRNLRSVCELHEQKVLDVYCVKCNLVVCAICFIDDHKNHEGSHVSKFVNSFRQQIEIHTESMNECSSQAQRKKAELMKVKEDMQQKVESLESDVVNRKDEIKEFADKHAHSILQSIGVLQRNKLKEIEVAAGEVDAYLSALDSFKTSCQKVMAQGTPSHICRSVSNLSARATVLQQQCQSLVQQEIQSFRVYLKKSELEEFLQSEDGGLIGKIGEDRDPTPKESTKREQTTRIKALEANAEQLKQNLISEKTTNKALQTEVERLQQELDNEKKSNETFQADLYKLKQKIVTEEKSAKEELEKTKTTDFLDMILKLEREKQEMEQRIAKAQEERKILAELRYKSDPVLVQRIGTRASEEEKKEIVGLAILDKELFVVSDGSSEVEVYDVMKSQVSFSRRWNLKELLCPGDIGSCVRNKCLYIFDYKPCDQSKEILRVDPNGKLIKKWSTGEDYGFTLSVTVESNVILIVNEKNKLNEYSPDGQLIREINLSSVAGIRCPLHAIKLANGHFVVSHGHFDDELHRLCIVDAELKLKTFFGGKPGSTAENMCNPAHFAIDGNGFVMVVDRVNGRVLLLDSDLQFKREILSNIRHGLRNPVGILLDETNGRLFVVDSELKTKNKLFNDAPISIFDF